MKTNASITFPVELTDEGITEILPDGYLEEITWLPQYKNPCAVFSINYATSGENYQLNIPDYAKSVSINVSNVANNVAGQLLMNFLGSSAIPISFNGTQIKGVPSGRKLIYNLNFSRVNNNLFFQ